MIPEALCVYKKFCFVDGETKVVVNAKLFLSINKNIDIKINLKHLEQDTKMKLLERKKDIFSRLPKQ